MGTITCYKLKRGDQAVVAAAKMVAITCYKLKRGDKAVIAAAKAAWWVALVLKGWVAPPYRTTINRSSRLHECA